MDIDFINMRTSEECEEPDTLFVRKEGENAEKKERGERGGERGEKGEKGEKCEKGECGICIEEMNTIAFKKPNEEQEDGLDKNDASCIRLKCGHAYHFVCQMPAMRMGKFCSLCRDEIKQKENVTHHFQITSTTSSGRNPAFQFEVTGSANDDTAVVQEVWEETMRRVQETISQNQELVNTLDFAFSEMHDEDLAENKRKLKDAISVHKKFANDLKEFRARYMRKALKDFRIEFMTKYKDSEKRIKELLNILKEKESSLLQNKGFSRNQIQTFFSSDNRHNFDFLVSNGAIGGDPARHRFWYR
jgi:hypothetical protein